MNYALIVLFIITIIYLQWNFMSFSNIILMALLVGVYVVLSSNDDLAMIQMIYLSVIGVILVISFVYKVIQMLNAMKDYDRSLQDSNSKEVDYYYYVDRQALNFAENGLKKMDIKESDIKKDACETFDNISGKTAEEKLEECGLVCANIDGCDLVALSNKDGNNDKCVYYSHDGTSTVELQRSLDTLPKTKDTDENNHYALLLR